jgi:hypothetical protein
MRKRTVFSICALLSAVLLMAVVESGWLLAAVTGIGLGTTAALFVYAYPRDVAPPADRRHEAAHTKRIKSSARS